jgi:hypothetical protein
MTLGFHVQAESLLHLFGSHYDKLKMIKIYDPVDLFVVGDGVGSDDWDTSLNCHL